MNYGPLVFLAAFFALASSWFGMVWTPQIQVGQLQQTNTLSTGVLYPAARPGLAQQGLQVYRANGCVYCHTQQVGQDGALLEVVLSDAGTNHAALMAALRTINPSLSDAGVKRLLGELPQTVARLASRPAADTAVKTLNVAGAKAHLWVVATGSDIARGWGKRRTVAEDFLFDSPALPGAYRLGPDLANVGIRQPDVNWHLRHLYAPRLEVKDSSMPRYRFLFHRRKAGRTPSPDALQLPAGFSPGPDWEIVPTAEAEALAAYLVSLRADAPLFISPLSAPAAAANSAATNAPATAPAVK